MLTLVSQWHNCRSIGVTQSRLPASKLCDSAWTSDANSSPHSEALPVYCALSSRLRVYTSHDTFARAGRTAPPRLLALEALEKNALSIITGRIVAIDQGFFEGSPASMLRVTPTEVIRTSPQFDTAGDLYVYYPAATFSVGDTQLCSMARAHRTVPVVGDELVVYAHHSAVS